MYTFVMPHVHVTTDSSQTSFAKLYLIYPFFFLCVYIHLKYLFYFYHVGI